MPKELWLPVVGYEGIYEVSSIGRVRSVISHSHYRNKIRVTCATSAGYPQLVLCKAGVRASRTVHGLVAAAFIPNPDKLPHVNHKNGIKTDNRVCNLERVTVSQNRMHCVANGLCTISKGTDRWNAAVTDDIVREIRRRYIPYKVSTGKLAKEFGITQQTAWSIVFRETWKHVL